MTGIFTFHMTGKTIFRGTGKTAFRMTGIFGFPCTGETTFRATGISPCHLQLRATCASLYVKRGMDPFSLKTLLGHESVTTTMDHYARLTEEELRAVWKRSNPLAGTDHE